MIDQILDLLKPLSRRIANIVARAVVTGVDDSQTLQSVQLTILDGETRDEVERFQNYGFSSRPVDDGEAEAVVVFPNGSRGHGLAICVEDRRYRVTNLESGEVAIYSKHGQTIVLKTNGDIELNPKSGQKVKISADVDVTGTLTASVDVVGGGKHLATHTHSAGTAIVTSCGAGAGASTGGVTGAPS
jgi:phage gp45-like